MKRLMLVVVLGTLSLAAPAQSEQENAVTIRGYQIELPATPHRLSQETIDDYKGAYDMSNGGSLSILKVGRRMYAEVNNGTRREMVAAAPNVFVALDRQLKLTLNRDRFNDNISGELLMVVPGSTVAQGPQFRHIGLVTQR